MLCSNHRYAKATAHPIDGMRGFCLWIDVVSPQHLRQTRQKYSIITASLMPGNEQQFSFSANNPTVVIMLFQHLSFPTCLSRNEGKHRERYAHNE